MTARQVLSFPFGGRRFNYRVAAIIVVDGHVLVSREDEDDYVMLPGGRVELGEPSAASLARELVEELGMAGEIGPLVATSESFYGRAGEDYHELGLFYAARLPAEARPNGEWPWMLRHDEGHALRTYWVPLAGDGLERINLMPRWLPELLRRPPDQAVHVVHDECGGNHA